jgi:holin-like protein
MISALTLLLVCQLAGEACARALHLPVPGPVLGMAFLFGILVMRKHLRPDSPAIRDTALGTTAKTLLANLSLLFVPAGVGILQHAGSLATHGVAIAIALVVSTILTLAVTALVFRALARSTPSTEERTP